MFPSFPLVLSSASADGAALSNSVVATSILPASAIATLPAGALQIGSLLKLTLRGRISTVVTTPGTLTLDLRLGSVIISAFGAIALNVNAQTNATFEAELIARVLSLGAGVAATARCTMRFASRAVIGSPAAGAGGVGVLMLPETAPAAGNGFDSSAAQAINVFAAWSIANAANSIQVHDALLELKI